MLIEVFFFCFWHYVLLSFDGGFIIWDMLGFVHRLFGGWYEKLVPPVIIGGYLCEDVGNKCTPGSNFLDCVYGWNFPNSVYGSDCEGRRKMKSRGV